MTLDQSWSSENVVSLRRETAEQDAVDGISARTRSQTGVQPGAFRFAPGGAARPQGRRVDYEGLRFDLRVTPGGYAWWYIDALSDDNTYGLTMILFVGSVFSPYYAWSNRRSPNNHCALNVALYGPRGGRWSMTERGEKSVTRGERDYQIGRSLVSWDNGVLTIDVDEIAAPLPRRMRGQIKLHADGLGEKVFYIDDRGRHRWRPLAPFSRVSVDFADPDVSWTGHSYFDANDGDEPLERAFHYWDWSRTILGDKRTAILYNTDMFNGEKRSAALLVNRNGEIREFEPPKATALPSTPIWRIKRRTRAEGGDADVLRTLEDTPFYSRSVIESRLFGDRRCTVHESLMGPRLRSQIVKCLLPFRMPRIP